MPFNFNTDFTAQATAFDFGCGLHCLANAYILNLEHDKFGKEENESLEVLLKAFKQYYYPAAETLSTKDLKNILVNDLKSPVHREIVLSRVLRSMIQPDGALSRTPGVPVLDEEVRKVAHRLGMKVESYQGTKTHPIHNPFPDDLRPFLPKDAPLLKLFNQHGGHWEWEYNIFDSDPENRAAADEYNTFYGASVPFPHGSNNDGDNVAKHAEALKQRVMHALQNRRAQNISKALSDFEAELEAKRRADASTKKTKVPPNPDQTSGQTETSSPNWGLPDVFKNLLKGGLPWDKIGADSARPTGFMGLFTSLFQTLSPLFAGKQGTKSDLSGSKIATVYQSFFNTLHDFFKPIDPSKGGAGGLFALAFGWLGKLAGIIAKGAGLLESEKKKDPSRPFSEDETENSSEIALIAKYADFLPEEASDIKAKLFKDARTASISKEQIFDDLKNALKDYNQIPEYQELLFNQHLLKIPQPAQDDIRYQYHRSQGGPLAWKNLALQLKELGEENYAAASEVLLQEENRVLNQSFKSSSKKDKPELTKARKLYHKIVSKMMTQAPTEDQLRMRFEMLTAIERCGKNGVQIQAELNQIVNKDSERGVILYEPSKFGAADPDSHKKDKKGKGNTVEEEQKARFESLHNAFAAADAAFPSFGAIPPFGPGFTPGYDYADSQSDPGFGLSPDHDEKPAHKSPSPYDDIGGDVD